ncbi:MAG: glycolate oxidase subunit GlcE [Burkholderiales bacterium]
MKALIEDFAASIRKAAETRAPIRVRGGGSKDFYGGLLAGSILDASAYSGIVDYEPSELVLTARCGTRLSEIENILREHEQMLAFEPPHFSPDATLGGCIAAGLSGPRRAQSGAVRDFILGVRVLNGQGEDLRFGGRVIKNVAGYDVSRLMAGALGTLGVLTEISLKVLPRPAEEISLRLEMGVAQALETMNRWAGKPYPISATCHMDGALYARMSGAKVSGAKLGGEILDNAEAFWYDLREHKLPFFARDKPLWRLSVKPTSPSLDLAQAQLIEWNGALRWSSHDLDHREAREMAANAGGHATLFRGGDKARGVFHPLPAPMLALHQRLKKAFDPAGILNPGRLYAEL